MTDFAYRLNLLKRINAVVINGQPVSHMKVFGQYNVWQCFQNRLFYEDLRSLELPALSHTTLKTFVLWFAAATMTRIALISARVRRPAVLIYSMDKNNSPFSHSDARIEFIYRGVSGTRKRFIEVFHAVLGSVFVHNIFGRRRPAVYDVGVLRLARTRVPIDWSQVNLSAFSELERPLVQHLIEKYIAAVPRFVARVEFYRRLIRQSGVRTVLAIDDTRSYGELMLAARLEAVHSYAFQHGHYTKYHLGWLTDGSFDGEVIRPERLYVWSDYWRTELLRLGTYFTKEEIIVGGLKEIPQRAPRPRNKTTTVGVPYEIDSDKATVKAYIDVMLASGLRVLFKLRSDVDQFKQLQEYGLSEVYHPLFIPTNDNKKILAEADVVAGTYSTYLYDMVVQERPVILLRTNSDFGEGILQNGLADEVSLDDSLYDRIHQVCATSDKVLAMRCQKLLGTSPILLENTVRTLL